MIPLRDSQPSRKVPVVTILLIALNLLIFLYQSTLTEWELVLFFHRFAFTPSGFFASVSNGQIYWPILTSMFLHGGLEHLIGNMWILWLFGDNVEDHLHPIKYLLFYIGTGFVAIMAHTLSMPHSDVFTVGASGAIAGVMGAYLILYPQARVLTLVPFMPFFINIPAFIYLVIWVVLQIFSGLFQSGGGIAWWAHVAGFLAGMLICIRGRKRRRDETTTPPPARTP